MKNLKRYSSYLKYKIRNILPKYIYRVLSSLLIKKRETYFNEKSKSFGKLNPQITFFVIRRRPPGWGFFSNLFFVLKGISYAEKNGYVPVVDMENYWMSELSSLKGVDGEKNAWCYFFKQVSEYSLGQVYQSKNVILSNASRISGGLDWLTNRDATLITNLQLLQQTHYIINQHIVLNEKTSRYIKEVKKNLNWTYEDTLGIFIRGAVYYENLQFPKEFVPPLDYFISEVRKMIISSQIKKIYISTEDLRIYKLISNEFKHIHVIPSLRYDFNITIDEWLKSQVLTNIGGLKEMGFEKNRTYLTEAMLLSDCKNFIGTFSNATAFILASTDLTVGDHRLVLQDKVINFNNDD